MTTTALAMIASRPRMLRLAVVLIAISMVAFTRFRVLVKLHTPTKFHFVQKSPIGLEGKRYNTKPVCGASCPAQ